MRAPYFLLLLIFLFFHSCTLGRFVFWNFANIDDYEKFQNRPIANDPEQIFEFPIAESDTFRLPNLRLKKKKYEFLEGLKKSKTVAFLVLRNDSILYEHYDHGYEKDTPVNSFSVAKSYVSTLLGMARDEGKIESLEDPITAYVPELPESLQKVSLRNLLEMRSGIDFKESYFNPFGDAAAYYYGRNIKKQFPKLALERDPDGVFQYRSVNTQLLAEALENIYDAPLNEIMAEKIWIPLGSEQAASWSIDAKKQGTFKAFCCLNGVARDFARLGILFMNEGEWNGTQLISKEWVREATAFKEATNNYRYKYQWWGHTTLQTKSDSLFYPERYIEYSTQQKDGTDRTGIIFPLDTYSAEGFLGQYIYVNPKERVVIVRLGEKSSNPNPSWRRYFEWIAVRNGVNRNS